MSADTSSRPAPGTASITGVATRHQKITAALSSISARLKPILARVDLAPQRVIDAAVLEPLHGTVYGDTATPAEAATLGLPIPSVTH